MRVTLCLRAVFLLCFRNPLTPEYDTDLLFSCTKNGANELCQDSSVADQILVDPDLYINSDRDEPDRYVCKT